jgi:putative endonuclease
MSRDPTRSPEARSGGAGEALAAQWLVDRGFRLEARNLRTRHGEIDLLLQRRRTWIAVEVKARRDHPAPERTVDAERLDRLQRALLALAPHLRPRPRLLRIDVVAVRWRDGAAPELSHFPALRTFARGGAVPWAVRVLRALRGLIQHARRKCRPSANR